jgi:HK97 family phage major capsid protein
LEKAFSLITIKAIDDEQRIIEGIASTPTPDRVGDVVEPQGAKYALPLPLLLDHRSDQQVGHVEVVRATKDGISFRARIPKISEPGEVKNLVDRAWHLVKYKLRQATSIGFRALDGGVEVMKDGGYRYKAWEWLELSLVVVPAQQEALINDAKSADEALRIFKSLDREQRGVSARNTASVRLLSPENSGASPKSNQLPPESSGVPIPKDGTIMTTKTIAEQIVALENTRTAKFTDMTAVMQKSIDEGRSTDASEQETFDTLEQEVGAIDGDLKRLRALEKAAAVSAKPVGEVKNAVDAALTRAGHSPAVAVKHEEKLEKGIAFTRFVSCVALGKGNLMQSMEIAKNRYGESHDMVGLLKGCVENGSTVITKAAVAAGTTGDSAWAGSLVALYQRYTGDFIEFLRPMTILGKLGQNGVPGPTMVPFNINIAGQTSGATGYWVGEGQPKPVTRAGFNSVNLAWAKIAAFCVLSQELVRFSSPNAETLMRNELARAIVERADIDFIDPNVAAITGVRPASVTNGVVAINSTGNDADAIREDIALLMAPFINANISPTGAVFVMSTLRALRVSLMRNALGQKEFPDLMMTGGTLEGIPVIATEYATSDSNGDDIVLMNAPDIWLADDGEVTIDASREASLQMLDNPTVDSANGGNPVATSLVSMFQTNSIALLAERYINYQKRRAQAVQVLNNANWGDPGAS